MKEYRKPMLLKKENTSVSRSACGKSIGTGCGELVKRSV